MFPAPAGAAAVARAIADPASFGKCASLLRRERCEGEAQAATVALRLRAGVPLAVDQPPLVGEPVVVARGEAVVEALDIGEKIGRLQLRAGKEEMCGSFRPLAAYFSSRSKSAFGTAGLAATCAWNKPGRANIA